MPVLNHFAWHRSGDSEPLLITTLDGRVAAVDRDTGQTLWTFDTENALVSAKGSAGYSFNVVPGVQGELYTQPRGGQGGFQVTPLSADDIHVAVSGFV